MVPYLVIIALALASYLLHKLTLWASLTAILIAISIFLGASLTGLEMLGAFFIMAVAATSWHKREKEVRDARQVLANGGVAAICGLLGFITHLPIFTIMMAGSLASATADTLSSELGMVYGRRFYNVITYKTDEKGLDGVISLEGTLIGIVGAAIIGLLYGDIWIVAIAGAIGNYVDSLLGATLEHKGILTNNLVNLLNTMTGALVAALFIFFLRH